MERKRFYEVVALTYEQMGIDNLDDEKRMAYEYAVFQLKKIEDGQKTVDDKAGFYFAVCELIKNNPMTVVSIAREMKTSWQRVSSVLSREQKKGDTHIIPSKNEEGKRVWEYKLD